MNDLLQQAGFLQTAFRLRGSCVQKRFSGAEVSLQPPPDLNYRSPAQVTGV
jgi:hypothetical protein